MFLRIQVTGYAGLGPKARAFGAAQLEAAGPSDHPVNPALPTAGNGPRGDIGMRLPPNGSPAQVSDCRFPALSACCWAWRLMVTKTRVGSRERSGR